MFKINTSSSVLSGSQHEAIAECLEPYVLQVLDGFNIITYKDTYIVGNSMVSSAIWKQHVRVSFPCYYLLIIYMTKLCIIRII